jgi:ribosomal protein L17
MECRTRAKDLGVLARTLTKGLLAWVIMGHVLANSAFSTKSVGRCLRVLKCGFRTGDTAPMAYVELVDRPEPVTDDA